MLEAPTLTYHSEVFKEFNDSRVEEVVPPSVGNKGLNNGGKEIVSDYVAIVELVFQTHNLPTESQSG